VAGIASATLRQFMAHYPPHSERNQPGLGSPASRRILHCPPHHPVQLRQRLSRMPATPSGRSLTMSIVFLDNSGNRRLPAALSGASYFTSKGPRYAVRRIFLPVITSLRVAYCCANESITGSRAAAACSAKPSRCRDHQTWCIISSLLLWTYCLVQIVERWSLN